MFLDNWGDQLLGFFLLALRLWLFLLNNRKHIRINIWIKLESVFIFLDGVGDCLLGLLYWWTVEKQQENGQILQLFHTLDS